MAEILVTGGKGKTGRRLVDRLQGAGHSPRVATRSPAVPGDVRFDWGDPGSLKDAFAGIRSVYLVAPGGAEDVLAAMQPGIDYALAAGVERFVLLSASSLDEGGPMMGAVHRYLRQRAPHWVVLRPTWFMQNFSEQQHLPTIRAEQTIYSATGQGRVPFIDAGDIAAVAAVALTDHEISSGEHILTGPRALSYDEVARILSQATGIAIRHQVLTEAQMVERFQAFGLEATYARTLAAMDGAIGHGQEDRTTDAVLRLTGRPPMDFKTFAHANCLLWRPAPPA